MSCASLKVCKKCLIEKSISDFYKCKSSKDGLQAKCIACDKAHLAQWREENKTHVAKSITDWQNKNKEIRKSYRANHYLKNKEKVNAQTKEYYLANKEKLAKDNSVWQKNNPEKIRSIANKRRSAKLKRTPLWLTQEDLLQIEALYLKAIEMEKADGLKYEVDHIYPLQGKYVSGLHVPGNLQILTASENRRKKNRWIP